MDEALQVVDVATGGLAVAAQDNLAAAPTGNGPGQDLLPAPTKKTRIVDAPRPRGMRGAPAPLLIRLSARSQTHPAALAQDAGLVSAAIGLAVLGGWILDFGVLKSLAPGLHPMKANAAAGFVVAGAALWLKAHEAGRSAVAWRRVGCVLSGLVALLGALTLAEYASGVGFGIDQLLFHESAGAVRTLAPGRMAPASALCFLLIGSALALDERARRRGWLAQFFAVVAGLVALASALAYLYGAPDRYGLGRNTQMALHSIAGFLVLAAGLLCLQPERGIVGLIRHSDTGGLVARRLLPAALLLPVAVGLLKRAGEHAGLWEPRFGSVLVALADIVLFALLVAWVAWSLSRADQARSQAERTLRESESRFRTLFEQSPAIKLLIDPVSGDIVDANAAAVGFYGYAAETLRTMRIAQIDVQAALDVQAQMQHAVVGDRMHLFFRHRLASGELRDVDVYSGPVEIDGRTLLESVVQDVSEQKRAEEERALLQAELLKAQRMEAVGRLAGGVAHNFRNFLTAIAGYSELALTKLSHDSDARLDIEEIKRAAARAGEVTSGLLAFSRREPGDTKPLDVNILVLELQSLLRQLIGEDVELETALTPGLALVEADRSQIEQSIMNLALNARDAMSKGGRLLIATANLELSETLHARGGSLAPGRWVSLAVSDTGCGMDEETRARIFEPFFTTKGERGTGLGLASVFGIVDGIGGRILVESQPDEGTTFTICLPALEQPQA
jgi:PAS domain S-box-containing protein